MSTTSAWFYNSGVIDSGDTFIFGDLSVDTLFTSQSEITFDGATKFADPDEILFDDVIKVNEILVYNSGTIPARIYADAVNTGSGEGFRWFFFSGATAVDGSVKKTIEASLPELTDEALNKILFFAQRKSSKTYPIKYFVLHSDCKYTKNEGYLPNLIKKKYLVQASREDFLAALEKRYLIKTPHSSRFACHLPPPGKA